MENEVGAIRRLLVANRGEIARRVFGTCRELGISTVAVFSDADAGSPHRRDADIAVRLPGVSSADTYLSIGVVLDAAKRAGADAVHPGYGFLSENAEFARRVIEAGLIWVGPPPTAIESMGSKISAKQIMAEAGVPVLTELTPDEISEQDLPVLIKASAGGGGRGMRSVTAMSDMADALASARREALSAFGDSTVFCEPLLRDARHIEVQILADRHGTVWTLGERECSIQRRHQKILEETPSPAVTPEIRAELNDAATNAARAIGYVGAGTVEFMLDSKGRFYFLEVNTRLQVEHPVTECVHGSDLVRLQIEVAEGARLPCNPPPSVGHAIEVRLYAEDPGKDWLPQSGFLHRFAVPDVDSTFGRLDSWGLRLDSGVKDGSEVTIHYDPMLAKIIAWAPTRAGAARRLAGALRRAEIHGLTTNRDLLVRILEDAAFLAGRTDTGYLDRWLGDLALPLASPRGVQLSGLAAAVVDAARNRARSSIRTSAPLGWRNVPSRSIQKSYEGPTGRLDIGYSHLEGRFVFDDDANVAVSSVAEDGVDIEVEGCHYSFAVSAYPDDGIVCIDSPLGAVTLTPIPQLPLPEVHVADGSLLAPLPGTIARMAVEEGQSVDQGVPLMWIEAMKMEHMIAAPAPGVVAKLLVSLGEQVELGAPLAVLETSTVPTD